MKKLFLLFVAIGCVGAAYGTTAAKGVFSVSSTKKVQFANANSIYRDTALIQWKNLAAAGEEGWDVLTGDEWSYLLAAGRTGAEDLNALGTVGGQTGLIILPDGWVQPEGVPAYQPIDVTGIGYEYNEYTAVQWAVMADAGAVFLPCAGYGWMDGTTYKVEDPTDHGAYWAKDEVSSGNANAHCMKFNTDGEGSIHDFTNAVKTNYYSVILVREVTVLDEEDELSAFSTKLGTADNNDYALVNRTLVKDGTLYTLCLPFDVPDIEDSPLAGAEVFTFDGGSVSGSTGNESLHLNLSRLSGTRLTQGVPYLLRWSNTGETLPKPLYFANVANWDNNTTAADDPGNANIKLHGVYPKAHIPGYTSGSVAHYNFFLGANNTLYWPDDDTYPEDEGHNMKGFRAYFYITPGGGPSPAPSYRNMPVVWKIGEATTDIGQWTMDNGQWTKVLRDGQIVLIIDGKEYDLQGKVIGNW